VLNSLALIPFITALLTTPPALAEEVQENPIYHVRNESDILLDVPYVNQKDDLIGTENEWAGGSACGPASLTMVFNYFDRNYQLENVVNELPTTVYVKGRMFYDLPSGPSYFGFTSHDVEVNTIEIYKALDAGHPLIMNIQNYDGITGHAVVVVGIRGFDGTNAKSLVVHDPFRAPYRVFDYVNENTLLQPEGYMLPIGILKPFYVTEYSLASSVIVE